MCGKKYNTIEMEGFLRMLRSMDMMTRDKRQRAKADPGLGTKRGFALGAVLVYDQAEFKISATTHIDIKI